MSRNRAAGTVPSATFVTQWTHFHFPKHQGIDGGEKHRMPHANEARRVSQTLRPYLAVAIIAKVGLCTDLYLSSVLGLTALAIASCCYSMTDCPSTKRWYRATGSVEM